MRRDRGPESPESDAPTRETLLRENQALRAELEALQRASGAAAAAGEAAGGDRQIARAAVQAQRLTDERLSLCLDTLLDCLVIMSAIRDEAGRIIDFQFDYVNPAACRSNRLSAEAHAETTLLKLLPAHRETRLFEAYCRVVETGEPVELHSFEFEGEYAGQRLKRIFEIRAWKVHDGFAATWRDVTERHALEEARRAVEERHRGLLAALPAAMYTCDPDGLITFFNEQAVALWGRTPQIGDPDQRFCGALRLFELDGTPLPHHHTPMALALRRGQGVRGQEVIIERPDGSRVLVSVNVDPLHDAAGNVCGAINIFTDVTERKQIQQALAERNEQLQSALQEARVAEEEVRAQNAELELTRAVAEIERGRYHDLFEQAPEAYVVTDDRGVVIELNRAAVDLLRARAETAAGLTLSSFVAPEHRAELLRLFSGLRRGARPARLQLPMISTTGHAFEAELAVSVEPAAGAFAPRYRWFIRDTSAQQAAQAALRESEQRLKAILAVLPVAVFIADADGRLINVNAAAARIWGGRAPLSGSPDEYGDYKAWWPASGKRVAPQEWAIRAIAFSGFGRGLRWAGEQAQ